MMQSGLKSFSTLVQNKEEGTVEAGMASDFQEVDESAYIEPRQATVVNKHEALAMMQSNLPPL